MCLIVFIVFAGGFIGASIYGFLEGQPGRLFAPVDGNGNFCGYDTNYTDYSYLYFTDLTASNIWEYAVCVSSCPTNTSTIDCVTTSYVTNCSAGEHYNTYSFLGEYCLPIYDDLPSDLKTAYDSSGIASALNSA